jgi:hypothetical protein
MKLSIDKLEGIFKKYPLLEQYSDYYGTTKKHYQEYIDAINALKEKESENGK